jgi:hypothetical protein
MAMTIHVDIVSAEAEIFSGTANMVFAPAEMGEVGIAPRHTPLLTRLRPGEVRVQVEGKEEQFFYVSGGIWMKPRLSGSRSVPKRLSPTRPVISTMRKPRPSWPKPRPSCTLSGDCASGPKSSFTASVGANPIEAEVLQFPHVSADCQQTQGGRHHLLYPR